MKDHPIVESPKMPPPTSRLVVTKDQASKLRVGESVSLTVSGKVQGITQCYDSNGKYEVIIESPKVGGYEDNEADKAVKDMKGE